MRMMIEYLLSSKEKNFILSLPHGEIIRNNKLLKTKNLIHFHPGRLPLFRGATSIYYSLLRKKEIGCSTIIMSSELDGGNLLFEKKFILPKKIKDIDRKYDIEIRKVCLRYLLKNFTSPNIFALSVRATDGTAFSTAFLTICSTVNKP